MTGPALYSVLAPIYFELIQNRRTRAMSGSRASLFSLPQPVLEDYIVGRLPCDDVVRFWAAHPRFQTPGFWGRQYALRHRESAAHAAALGMVSSVWPLESGSRDEFGEEARFVMGRRRKTLEMKSPVHFVAFSPDGRTLASSSDYVQLWDAVTGAPKKVLLSAPNGVEGLAFSPDGSTLVVTVSQSRIVIVDAVTCAVRTLPGEAFALGRDEEEGCAEVLYYLRDHTVALKAFALSPDGRTVVARSHDHTALLVDAATGATKATLTGQLLTPESADYGRIEVVFSPDGRTLACGGANNFPVVMLWDVATGVLKARLMETHASLVFSPDSRTIATSCKGNTMLWDTETCALKATLGGCPSYDMAFSPDGCMVATCHVSKEARLWDAETGALKAMLGCDEPALSVVFSPDGRTLATCHEAPDYETDVSFVNLWDTATGALRATLSGSGEMMCDVVFSPDGRTLVAAADEGIHMWGVGRFVL